MNTIKQLAKRIFQYEARLILRKYKPKIIAISGSVGKTSTREALYLVLSKKFFVRKSEKSFTAELGVPLAIIGCTQGTGSTFQWILNVLQGFEMIIFKTHYPDFLILEIDADKPGDLYGLSTWLHPDMLVATAVGDVPAHVELFGTVDELLAEKKYLLDSVSRDGCIVYNSDDQTVSHVVQNTELKKISCGIFGESNVRGSVFNILYAKTSTGSVPTGMRFEIKSESNTEVVTVMDSLGEHNEYAMLLAIGAGQELGISLSDCISAFKSYVSLPGRMNIISGLQSTVIIDDSYNASPIAMRQALHVFQSITGSSRKIVVLGDMLELGKYSADEHKKIANQLQGIAEYVICVGIRSRGIVDELLSMGFPESNIMHVDTAEKAGGELQNMLRTGDSVLVKGSQAMRMERVVEEVMRHPEDKAKLLVRQEPEWLLRD
ncbi:MAG: UDP-N-acetylmuramoyl-tripeptide--D-alanyl-D-alanine ligase [Patescibacteria group bacterium]